MAKLATPASFKKGMSGNTKGRPKGIKDIRVKMYDVAATLERNGYDPIQSLLDIANNKETKAAERIMCNKILIERVAPLLKSVDNKHSGDVTINNNAELKIKLETQIAQLRAIKIG